MKLLYSLLLLLFIAPAAYTQGRDNNKTRQIEQLQQLKQTVLRKIDTIHLQLTAEADSIEEIHKKLEHLKTESNKQDKPDIAVQQQDSKLSRELLSVTNLVNQLQKKFDQRLSSLDKAVNLQKDLEDKINTLARENNR